MDALDHFTIPVSGLHNGLHEYDFFIDEAFFRHFEGSPLTVGEVAVHFLLEKHPEHYTMTFRLKGTVQVTCDRCLELFNLPLEDTRQLLVKFDEKEWEDADVVYIQRGTPKLNIAAYIYEFINLALPMKKNHEAAGESCDPEMLKYLSQPEQDTDEAQPRANPLWEALKGFQFKEN